MKYEDGEEVRLGDRVSLGTNDQGVVVCNMDGDEFTPVYTKDEWGYLMNGVLIDFPAWGLIHYETPDPDLQLIARAAAAPKPKSQSAN